MEFEIKPESSISRYYLAILLFSIFFGITITLFFITKKKREKFNQELFTNRSHFIKSEIEERMNSYILILRSARSLFQSSDTVTQKEWDHFVKALQIDKYYPGAHAIGYAEVIRAKDSSNFVKKIGEELHSNFNIWPRGKRDLFSTIVYYNPFKHNDTIVIGFDMFSEKTRAYAMQKAINDNHASISGKVTLLTEPKEGKQIGFLIYLPIYKTKKDSISFKDRQDLIKGFVFSPFRSEDLIGQILKNNYPGIEIEVYDRAISKNNLLYDRDKSKSNINSTSKYQTIIPIQIDGNKWYITCTAVNRFNAFDDYRFPSVILITGTIISILVYFVTWALINSKTKTELAKEALNRKNSQLTKINNDLDNFVYTASHDLKAPINNVEGLTELMKDQLTSTGDKKSLSLVEMMEESIIKLKNTIIELTDIGRIQKETEETYEIIDFKELIDEIVYTHSQTIKDTDANITLDLDVKEIKFSKKNLRSMIDNLISNSLKYYNPEHSPKIEIKTYNKDKHLHLSIKDNCLGIPKDQLKTIFGMFKRAHSHVPGTGIGLYLVKRIMDNSGGAVNVESKVGEGSKFTLVFKEMKK